MLKADYSLPMHVLKSSCIHLKFVNNYIGLTLLRVRPYAIGPRTHLTYSL